MIALRFEKPGTISKIERPKPAPDNNEVLVKVAYSGICGTDLHILKGESPAENKIILGHEFCGFIEDIGSNVSGFSKNQPVCIDPNNYCGTCEACRKGSVHFCSNLKPTGVAYDGGWAEYCVIPSSQVYSVPDQFPLEWGALVEPVSCIIHGWDRLQPFDLSDKILIMGSGLIGLLWGILLRQAGYEKTTYSEPNPSRMKFAQNFGFNTIHPQSLKGESNKFNTIIDCSGNPSAIESAPELAKPKGKILIFGICPQGTKVNFEPFQIFRKELSILGSVINPFTFSRAIDWIQKIQIPLEKLGVQFYPLSEYHSALDQAENQTANKVIFSMIE
jgi:D-arabinitol dehydrogenase (NADP+)